MTIAPTRNEVRNGKEQADYARLMDFGGKAGLLVLVLSLLAEATNVLPSSIPTELLTSVWSQPLPAYLLATGAPTGWNWVFYLQHGDFASLAGVALMAGCSLPCLFSATRFYLSRQDRLYAAICTLEIIVLLVAASGFLNSGC